MERWIKIRNLKSIEYLDFKVPEPGVHLLSGTNGAGKTTVLACLRRIGNSNAFQSHFLTSLHSNKLDNFDAAEVIYAIDDKSVTYAYAGERWVPRPRSASNLIRSFSYPNVFYAGATAARITPRPEDFSPGRANLAPLELREAANSIFETKRFDELRTINLTTGNRNQAFVLIPPGSTVGGSRQRYISEKNFSLGELCVLKLLRELIDCDNGSLVLIDELELALHPRAQIGLIEYLRKIAKEKALTVIVSTHSVTLLKNSPRSKIMFLEKRETETVVLRECFPAYALGNLALSEERVPDVVLYVEDEVARSVMENLVKLVITQKYSSASDVFPTVEVIPVGDFQNVVRFFERNRAMLPEQVSQWMVLDHDVQAESLPAIDASDDPIRSSFHEFETSIRYFPWTPEVGIIQYLVSNREAAQKSLRKILSNNFVTLPFKMLNLTANEGKQRRAQSKQILKKLVTHICEAVPSAKEDRIAEHITSLFCEHYFQHHRQEAMQLIAPLVS